MTESNRDRCAICIHIHELKIEARGPVVVGAPKLYVCRRYPKQMTISGGIDHASGQMGIVAGASYPPTTLGEWCGEFEPFEDEQP